MPFRRRMPRRRQNRRKNIRRRYRRRYRRNPARGMLSKGIGFPLTLSTKLTYSADVNFSGSTTVFHTFRANGLFDPDRTGAGLQPLYFDQLMAVYTHYRVNASKITVIPFNQNASSVTMSYFGLGYSQVGVPGISWEAFVAQPGTIRQLLPNATAGIGRKMTQFKKTKSVLSVKDVKDNADLSGTSSADPVLQWYWVLCSHDWNTDNNALVGAQVRITYYCEFWGRNLLPLS